MIKRIPLGPPRPKPAPMKVKPEVKVVEVSIYENRRLETR
jgi:hypothetical protein